MLRVLALLAICLVVLGLPTSAPACSIPVFRYALEHWQPDSYRLFVFTHGRPTADDSLALTRLQETAQDASTPRRMNFEIVDLDAPLSDDAASLWSKHSGDAFPWLVLQQPGANQAPGRVVWTGPLQSPIVSQLRSSALRSTISQQLIEGESIVWLLLESGDAARDERAWQTLSTELTRLQDKLELPPIDPADAAELTVLPESLKLSFAAHRLSRAAADEQALIQMLLATEPDLRNAELAGEPMAFPIFGRGRVLYALIGDGINAATIEEACRFLTAGCQCTVKQENPGVDLLFDVDWSRFIEPTVPLKTTLPPLVGLQNFGDGADAPTTSEPSPAAMPAETTPPTPATESSPTPTAVADQAESPHTAAATLASQSEITGWFNPTLLVLGGLAAVVTIASLFLLRGRN